MMKSPCFHFKKSKHYIITSLYGVRERESGGEKRERGWSYHE